MRIWIKTRDVQWEGSEIIGVYDNLGAAKASHTVWTDHGSGVWSTPVERFGVFFTVQEWTVMESKKSTPKGSKSKERNRDVRKG